MKRLLALLSFTFLTTPGTIQAMNKSQDSQPNNPKTLVHSNSMSSSSSSMPIPLNLMALKFDLPPVVANKCPNDLAALKACISEDKNLQDLQETLTNFTGTREKQIAKLKEIITNLEKAKENLSKEKDAESVKYTNSIIKYINTVLFYLSDKIIKPKAVLGAIELDNMVGPQYITAQAGDKGSLATNLEGVHWQELDHIATGVDVLHRLGLHGGVEQNLNQAEVIRLAPDYTTARGEDQQYQFIKPNNRTQKIDTKQKTEQNKLSGASLHENHITGILLDSRFGIIKKGILWETYKKAPSAADTYKDLIDFFSGSEHQPKPHVISSSEMYPLRANQSELSSLFAKLDEKDVLYFNANDNKGSILRPAFQGEMGELPVYLNLPALKGRAIAVGNCRTYRNQEGKIVLEPNLSSNFLLPGMWEDNIIENHFIFAPGTDISASVYEYGDGGKKLPIAMFKTGASMAAPYVAGVVALLKKYFPGFSMKIIKEVVFKTAEQEPETKFKFLNALNAFAGLMVVNMKVGSQVTEAQIETVNTVLKKTNINYLAEELRKIADGQKSGKTKLSFDGLKKLFKEKYNGDLSKTPSPSSRIMVSLPEDWKGSFDLTKKELKKFSNLQTLEDFNREVDRIEVKTNNFKTFYARHKVVEAFCQKFLENPHNQDWESKEEHQKEKEDFRNEKRCEPLL